MNDPVKAWEEFCKAEGIKRGQFEEGFVGSESCTVTRYREKYIKKRMGPKVKPRPRSASQGFPQPATAQ